MGSLIRKRRKRRSTTWFCLGGDYCCKACKGEGRLTAVSLSPQEARLEGPKGRLVRCQETKLHPLRQLERRAHETLW